MARTRLATALKLSLVSAILLMSGLGHAQDKYPSRPVHIVAAAAPAVIRTCSPGCWPIGFRVP